eukprot:SAG11_NODE_38202_length_253_cov_0.974026_1_plen_46_part_01
MLGGRWPWAWTHAGPICTRASRKREVAVEVKSVAVVPTVALVAVRV